MNHFAKNLKLLRKLKNLSQEGLANELGFKRTTLSGYENEFSEPSIDVLLKISSYFKLGVDGLVKQNLNLYKQEELEELLSGINADLGGKSLRILSTTVNSDNKENVELVPVSAKAGYVSGYGDPEFIASLPKLQLPFLSENRTYRAFPIVGDSMPPVEEHSFVVGQFLQNWRDLSNNSYAILVSREDGIVFKKISTEKISEGILKLISLNPAYEPYETQLNSLLEIWLFVCYISPKISDVKIETGGKKLERLIIELQRDLSEFKTKIK